MPITVNGKNYPDRMLTKEPPCDGCKMKNNCHPENCLTYVRWDAHSGVRETYYGSEK
jgi:hypothetical protein